MTDTSPTPPPLRYRRFTPLRVVSFLAIVMGYFLWTGSQKIPTGAAAGTSFNGMPAATQPASDLLRVAAFNIDGGVGRGDHRLNLDRTAGALRGYDLIGLEEVHGGSLSGAEDQAHILGRKLGLPWLFAPVERRWGHDSFGDGALTSLPVTRWQRFPLANEHANSNRELLLLQLQFNGKPLNVLITHLERAGDRTTELATVISLFNSLQPPAILMGDLNSGKDDPQIKVLRQTSGVGDPIGVSLTPGTPDTVDWIFTRGLRVIRGGLSDNGASDHPMAWAELRANGD